MEVAGDPVPVGEDQQLFAEPVDAGQLEGEGDMGPEHGAHLDVRAGEVERVRIPDQQQQPVMRALGAERHRQQRSCDPAVDLPEQGRGVIKHNGLPAVEDAFKQG